MKVPVNGTKLMKFAIRWTVAILAALATFAAFTWWGAKASASPVRDRETVRNCAYTNQAGPCQVIWQGTDGRWYLWYVRPGHTLTDGSDGVVAVQEVWQEII